MFVIRRFFMERNVGKSLSSTLTCVSNNQQQTIFKSSTTGIMSNFEGKRTIHLSLTHCFGDLKEIFGFKDSNISNWVVEVSIIVVYFLMIALDNHLFAFRQRSKICVALMPTLAKPKGQNSFAPWHLIME